MDWIIDTDMGLDDRIALLYLAKVAQTAKSTFRIAAVLTQGTGLAHARPAQVNALRLLRFAGIPADALPVVGLGDSQTLDGFHQYPPEWRAEEDRLRGAALPSYKQATDDQDLSSAQILRQILHRSKSKVPILSLGTFTTIAQVLTESPRLKDKISSIVCMAGAIDVSGNLPGIPNSVAEFNAWIDPVATKLVIESGVPITMIPLDATNQVPLTEDFITNFKQNTQGDVADYIANAWEDALKNPLGEYYHWDPLAAAIAVNPDLITRFGHARVKVNAQVEREKKPADVPFGAGKSFDRLSWLGDARRSLDAMKSGWTKRDRSGERIDIVFSPDVKGFETEMITTFQRQTNELDTMTLPPFALPPCP